MTRNTAGRTLRIGVLLAGPICVLASTGCTRAPAADAWRFVTDLRGFSVHAVAAVPGGVLLAGERTATQRGVILRYDERTHAVAVVAEPGGAAQLKAISSHDVVVAAGRDVDGRGLLLVRTREEEAWQRVRLPTGVTEAAAVAVSARTLAVAGAAGDRGVLLTGDAVRLVARAYVEPAPGAFARLDAVAVAGGRLVAGGTDGARAVIVTGDGRAPPSPVGAAILSLATSGEAVFAGGYAGATDDEREGLLLRTAEGASSSTWIHTSAPSSVSVTALCFSGRRSFAAAATGSAKGDVILETMDGGVTWTTVPLPSANQPPTIEAVACDGDSAWAAGPSGLYRRSF